MSLVKYQYFYQTKQNEERSGWIKAKNRNDAYTLLRRDGIKPYRLVGNDPVPWQRWLAIAILLISLFATISAWLIDRKRIESQIAATADHGDGAYVPRHQIFGDPSIIKKGVETDWAACGFSLGEIILSKFAQPGMPAVIEYDEATASAAVSDCLTNEINFVEGEMIEYSQIKSIVKSMKDEATKFIREGDTAAGYIKALISRQKQEMAYYNAAKQEIQNARNRMNEIELTEFWEAKNAELRAIGVRTIPYPEDEVSNGD